MKLFLLASLFFFLNGGAEAAGKPLLLPKEKIAALKQKPCTFFHVWATWCTICLRELPDLIKVLAGLKKVSPIVVDVSDPFVQENFSKKWAVTLSAPFPMYVKPAGKDKPYLDAIDRDWSGALPFSVLFHGGVRKKTWVGALNLSGLPAELGALCR